MLVIIDYGLGNLRSILHKLHKIKIEACISSNVAEIEKADKLILPGVGHFAIGIKNIYDLNSIDVLIRKVLEEKTPILGICLGMQLLTRRSEEGSVDGLGWVNAQTNKFNFNSSDEKLKIPHVGWNTIKITKKSKLLEGIPTGSRFYFTHSYHLAFVENDKVLATTDYGYDFVSVIQKDNIYGTQFHPEKSHKIGMKIIQNFIENC